MAKILQIYDIGPPTAHQQAEAISGQILQTSRKLVEMGHQVTYLTGAAPGSQPQETTDGVEILRTDLLNLNKKTWNPTKLTAKRQLTFQATLWRSLKQLLHFDLYHGHLYGSGLTAHLLAQLTDNRAVNTIHGSYHPIWPEITPSTTESAFYRFAERPLTVYLAKHTAKQIHTASYSQKLAEAWGAPHEKLTLIENGVDTTTFHPNAEPTPRPPCCCHLIFTARRLVKKNGLEHLLRALPHIRRKHRAHLLIAGDGPEKQSLTTLARTLGIQDHTTFLGLTPNHNIPSLLAASDVAVIPSLIEAPSVFLLEAMATAKPTVATRVGSIPDVVTHMKDGILIDPRSPDSIAHAITLLLQDESLATTLGRTALRTVTKTHTIHHTARRLSNLYSKILKA